MNFRDAHNHNDSVSTHSSLNLNPNQNILEINLENKIDQSLNSGQLAKVLVESTQDFFLKVKKGRPMEDSNMIMDEVNAKVYDLCVDPVEYRKARKYV